MKTLSKLKIVLIVCSFVISMNSFSQDFTNVIKTSPIGLAFGNFNATYEKVLNTKSSVLFSASYMYKLLGADISAGGVGAGYRYYFTHAKRVVPTGFWVMPEADFAFGSVKDANDKKKSITTFSAGAQIGYQWAWDSGFTLDLGIGPHYTIINGDVDNTEISSKNSITPAATLAIGFAF